MDELPVTFADDWANIESEEYRDREEFMDRNKKPAGRSKDGDRNAQTTRNVT